MKSANTFYITEGKKQTPIKFHPSTFGRRKNELLPSGKEITRFTIEAVDNNFHFSIHGEHYLNPRDVLEIAPRFVRFRDGTRFDSPVYIKGATEQLPADERTARGLALDRAERAANTATGNKRQTRKRKKKNPRMTATNPNGAGRTRESPDLDAFLLRAWNAYANDKTIEVEGQRSLADFFQKSYWKKMTDFKTHETAFKKYVMKENRAEDRVKAIRKHIGREKTDRRMKRIKSL